MQEITPIVLLIAVLLLAGAGGWQLNRWFLAANTIDWGVPWVNRLDGFLRIYCRRFHRLQIVELGLPESGPAIVVANHISGLDPFLMLACCKRPLRFLIAREQYQRFGLRALFKAVGCIPVDRERSPEKAMRAAFRALREGEVVALFPHGKIHLDSDPPRKLKAGAASLALNTGAPIFPLRISGIALQGHVVTPFLFRSRAVITPFPAIESGRQQAAELQSLIQQRIEQSPSENAGQH